ncbi:MAG: hypothetical protein DSM106950_18905 [Stigonema ocellatum SAG 48.90 = DSM 106950]|nr:hypothetical protein [Stigonema ocellatum SAG 48.90 = DSM 106950]
MVTNCNVIHAQGRKTTLSQKIAYGGREGQLSDQGRSRTFYLYTPKSYNSRRGMPLVLVLHGHGGSGRSIAHTSRFNSLAEQKGFIVVYPDGIDQEWSLRDDVSFVDALIDHVKEIRNIDSHRIYAVGFSKGGILTQALACRLPNKIAAFASVAGALPVRLKGNCQPRSPVSMLMINGTNDRSVRYEGDDDTQQRGALISVPATIHFWRSHNGCPSSAQVRQLPHPRLSDGFKVKTSRYSDCSGGSEVLLAAVVGAGHLWPGGASDDVSVNKFNNKLGFNASKTIWDFFYRHHFPY